MKVWICIILYILTSMFCVFSKEVELDNIAAVVNDQIILKSDVDNILFLLKQEGQTFRIPLKINFLKEKVIQKLIVDELILQEAKKMNVIVTKKQINTTIKNIALKKNITVNELKNYILFHDIYSNFSYKNYVKNIERSLKIQITQDYELNKRVNISEQEINFLFKKLIANHKKFKKINLSYILFPILKNSSDKIVNNAKKLSDRIIDKLNKGYDFEKLNTEFKNNDIIFLMKKMFWMRLSDMQNIFSNTFDILKKGQVLGPFLGEKGFYILKINDIHNNKENILTEFYIQHCLIKPSIIMSNEESKKNIFNIYNNLKKGVYSFDYAVKNFSNDTDLSHKNGCLGWIGSELFNGAFNKALLHLKKNEISFPVKSNFGWHIVKLLNTRQTDRIYSFKKQQAYNILFFQKMILEKKHWIEDLKRFSYINIIES